MISCPKCRKENQDHYKFCLGCGAELPRDAAPKPFAPRTPPHGMKAVSPAMRPVGGDVMAPGPVAPMMSEPMVAPAISAPALGVPPAAVPRPSAASASAPPPAFEPPKPFAEPAPMVMPPPPVAMEPPPAAAAPTGDSITCPQCGHVNALVFKFCASCGFNLSKLAAPKASVAPAAAAPSAMGWKLTVLRADGSDAGTFDVPSASTVVGRDLGGIFSGDNYLSPKHARLERRDGKLVVKDMDSVNGTYIKLKRDVAETLIAGQMFRIGQEIIRFEKLQTQPSVDGVELMGSPSTGYVGRLVLVIGREQTGNAFPVPQTGVHIGRERGHVLFPEDGYVSGLHCSLLPQGETLQLTDLGSSNGTFLRLLGERELQDGDILLMGQQLFRVNQ